MIRTRVITTPKPATLSLMYSYTPSEVPYKPCFGSSAFRGFRNVSCKTYGSSPAKDEPLLVSYCPHELVGRNFLCSFRATCMSQAHIATTYLNWRFSIAAALVPIEAYGDEPFQAMSICLKSLCKGSPYRKACQKACNNTGRAGPLRGDPLNTMDNGWNATSILTTRISHEIAHTILKYTYFLSPHPPRSPRIAPDKL